jgi:hypothetical protein
MRISKAFFLLFLLQKLFPERENRAQPLAFSCCCCCLPVFGGPLLDTTYYKKKKGTENTSLSPSSARRERFGSLFLFSSLSLFQEKRGERDLIPILFPKREKKERKKREKSLVFGGKKVTTTKKSDEGRQTATAKAAKDD